MLMLMSLCYEYCWMCKKPLQYQITTSEENIQWKASVKEPNMFHNYETKKITHKVSDKAEYIELFGSSTRDRHARRRTNVILWRSANICVVVHNDLRRKKRTTRYKCRFSAASLALRVIFVRRKCPPIYASCMTISGGRTEQHVLIGFGELAAVD